MNASLCLLFSVMAQSSAGFDSSAGATAVGPLFVRVEVDRAVVPLSDTVAVTLIVTAPESVAVKSPELDDQAERFDILGMSMQGPDVMASEFGRLALRRFDIRLEPMQLGTFELGSASIEYRDGENDWMTGTVRLPRVQVVKGPTSSDDPATLRPPPELTVKAGSSRTVRWLQWLGGGLLLVVLAAFIYRWRRQGNAVSPVQRARVELDHIERSELFQHGDYRQVAERVCQTIRDYLEPAYGLHAPKQSTQEFLSSDRTCAALTSAQQASLEEFLASADVEKFGPAGPDEHDCRRLLRQAQCFLIGEQS